VERADTSENGLERFIWREGVDDPAHIILNLNALTKIETAVSKFVAECISGARKRFRLNCAFVV
jgi:hypothetical protein